MQMYNLHVARPRLQHVFIMTIKMSNIIFAQMLRNILILLVLNKSVTCARCNATL